HEGLHINRDHVIVEILDDEGVSAGARREGRVVVTDLNNFGMPLIRYDVGDIASLTEDKCSCGRDSARLEKILGRTADYLLKTDGGKVSGISLVEKTLTRIRGLRQLQIVQEELNTFSLNVVADHDFDEGSGNH